MMGLTVAAWMGAGLAFAHAAMTNPAAPPVIVANSRALVDDLFKLRPAAIVALTMFVAVWPVVFIGAHIGKQRGRAS